MICTRKLIVAKKVRISYLCDICKMCRIRDAETSHAVCVPPLGEVPLESFWTLNKKIQY